MQKQIQKYIICFVAFVCALSLGSSTAAQDFNFLPNQNPNLLSAQGGTEFAQAVLNDPFTLLKINNFDNNFGACPASLAKSFVADPNFFSSYTGMWKGLQQSRMTVQANIARNQKIMASTVRIPLRTLLFIRNLLTLRPVIMKLKELLSLEKFKNLRNSPGFAASMQNQEFLQSLANANPNRYSDPEFQKFIAEIQRIFSGRGVLSAMKAAALDEVDLSKIENLDSTLALTDFFKDWPVERIQPMIDSYRKATRLLKENPKAFLTPEYRAALENVPLLKNFPYPNSTKLRGLVAENYRDLLEEELSKFLKFYSEDGSHSLEDFYKQVDGESASTLSFDTLTKIQFFLVPDQMMVTYQGLPLEITRAQAIAIDGLARTLYGEVNSCESTGIEQATVIAKIVSDRASAVRFSEARIADNKMMLDKSIQSGQQLFRDKQSGVTIQDWNLAMQYSLKAIYGGKADFGRSDSEVKPDFAHPVTQVISRGDQFSGWRSVSKRKIVVPSVHPNIPSIDVSLNYELNSNDISALYNQLCPNTTTNAWKRMLKLAKDVVLDPKFNEKVRWGKALVQPPLFYTHAVPLDFVNEIPLPPLVDKRSQVDRLSLNENVLYQKANRACPQIRLWVSKNPLRYSPANAGK